MRELCCCVLWTRRHSRRDWGFGARYVIAKAFFGVIDSISAVTLKRQLKDDNLEGDLVNVSSKLSPNLQSNGPKSVYRNCGVNTRRSRKR